MKRMISLLLCVALAFSGCSQPQQQVTESSAEQQDAVQADAVETAEESESGIIEENVSFDSFEVQNVEPTYTGLNDESLLESIEDLIYTDAIAALDSEDYVVEAVNAIYVSKAYLEELAYNSKSNIFFGYTLDDLDTLFQGSKYYFTLGEDGQTTVKAFEAVQDSTIEEIARNVAIGSGVILVCVTVSALTGGVAPAVSMIFAVSAKTAATVAVSSAALGGVLAGGIRGVQTGNFDEAVKAGALAASEEFKWGAIMGATLGGATEAFALKTATKAGLSMNEVAKIQRESKLPVDVISQMHSWDEYLVYKDAGLKSVMLNGRTALVQDIDWFYRSPTPDGRGITNLERMLKGLAPIDPATDKAYQLHHIGQKSDATLAVLTGEQHQGNSAILNIFGKESEIDRKSFAKTRKEFWQSLAYYVIENKGI